MTTEWLSKWLKLQHLHRRTLPGSGNPLGWGTSHPTRVLCTSLITGQGCMGNVICQKSAASASSCIDLASSDCSPDKLLPCSQIRKTNKQTSKPPPPCVKMYYSWCPTWQRDGFSCPMEDLNFHPHPKCLQQQRCTQQWLCPKCVPNWHMGVLWTGETCT